MLTPGWWPARSPASRSKSSTVSVVGGTCGAAFGYGADQVGLGDQHLGIQQAEAVRQHLAALVVVEHAGDRAAFDRGQHHQHGIAASSAA